MSTITTTFRMIDEVTAPLSAINQGFDQSVARLVSINSMLSIFSKMGSIARSVANEIDNLTNTYSKQYEQEVKLYTILQQRMGASRQDFESLRQQAKVMQEYGIYNDQMILQGMQEIATFVQTKEQVSELGYAVANLTAQQYGLNASGDNLRQTATLLGRMLNGQTNGLNKLNLTFTDAEKKILKYGEYQDRVAIILDKVTAKVGDMNEALGKTPVGTIANLNNQFQDMQEELGRLLQPFKIVALQIRNAFMTKILEKFNQVMKGIKDNTDKLKKAINAFATASITVLTALIGVWVVLHWKQLLVITVLSGVIRAFQQLGNTGGEIIGGLIAAITWIGTTVINVGKIITNIIATIYNAVAWVINTIGGAIKDFLGGGGILQLIVGFFNVILSGLSVVASVVDAIFGTKIAKTINGWIDDLSNATQLEKSTIVEYMTPVDMTNPFETAGKAYNLGSGLMNNINDAVDGIKNWTDEYPMFGVNGKGEVNVNDGDLIDIAKDYRDLLMKRAVERFNLQMSNLTPSINIDHVDVHKEADANNVLNSVASALEEVVNSNLSIRQI